MGLIHRQLTRLCRVFSLPKTLFSPALTILTVRSRMKLHVGFNLLCGLP